MSESEEMSISYLMQLLSESLWVKMAQCLILLELKKKSIEFQMLVNAEAPCEGGEKRAHYGGWGTRVRDTRQPFQLK